MWAVGHEPWDMPSRLTGSPTPCSSTRQKERERDRWGGSPSTALRAHPSPADMAPALALPLAGRAPQAPGGRLPVGTYGFMLKKSLMPSGLTGLLLLFFSATDFSLVQVRCTFSGAGSASSAGDGELLEKAVAFLSWMSCTCGREPRGQRGSGQTWPRPCPRPLLAASPPPPASPRRRPPAPRGR